MGPGWKKTDGGAGAARRTAAQLGTKGGKDRGREASEGMAGRRTSSSDARARTHNQKLTKDKEGAVPRGGIRTVRE